MEKKAWVIAADMGYGHQRAAYPLKDIAYQRIINANSDKIISRSEKRTWENVRWFYEWISKTTEWPFVGNALFGLFNNLLKIDPYYPRKDNSKPTLQVIYLEKKIKKGLGKSIINLIRKKDIPAISTIYIPSIAANYHGIKRNYCVITDSDINRVWVPKNPKESNIIYLAPCKRAVNRLVSYGVDEKKIHMTGFPLPKECTGKNLEIAKKSLARRLINLDPNKAFLNTHLKSIKSALGNFDFNTETHPLTLAFVVGGAGAQKEIGVKIMKSLKDKIINKKIRLILVAGTHLDIRDYFMEEAENIGLSGCLQKSLLIISEITKKDYFEKFSKIVNETDILWTKPSELSFYSGLGIPILIAPHIGSQEAWNRKWLIEEVGSGIDQEEPGYASEWIEDWVNDGRLARKAWQGFVNVEKMGTYKIEKILFGS
jgi:hypothetical protein